MRGVAVAFKLYTVSSKSLMQSVVLLKYHTVTERERRGGKSQSQSSRSAVVRTNIVAQRDAHRRVAKLRDSPRGSKGAARRNLNVRRACLPIEAIQPHAGKLMTAKIQID